MATFTYKGTTADGRAVEETVEAKDRYLVYERARSLGHSITALEEETHASWGQYFTIQRLNALLSRVKQDEIVMLSRNLGAMLRAGLPLTRALSVSERQSRNQSMKNVLVALREEVQRGKQFHEALRLYPRIFSRLYVAMVRAGEEGGALAAAFDTLAVQMERSSNLKKKIRGAMIYPIIVISAMAIIGVLMMIYVVPVLTTTFKELQVELPLSTRIILGISDFLSNYTVIALGLLGTLVVVIPFLYRSSMGRRAIEWTLLRLPVIGTLVRETNAARTARTLASLLRAGVDVVNALSITGDVVQNSFFREVIAAAAIAVEKGKPMSEEFAHNEHLYPVLLGEMISVGEETGQISQLLEEVALFYESEVERKTKDLSTIIEPVLMIVIGAAVGFFALAMISPIYSISDSIG